MCSWRPDSETVAFEGFRSNIYAENQGFKGLAFCLMADSFEVEDFSGVLGKALFSASAVFGPKGALSLWIG